MASALGLNVGLVYVSAFAIGCFMAGLGGAIIVPSQAAVLGMGIDALIVPVAARAQQHLKQCDQQLEPLRGRAAQGARKNAAWLKRGIEFDRRRAAQIQSTNHRHNYG